MTRTERSFTPRAIIKDRSESKSGLDKSIRKGGAGAHNWGSYADEQELEFRAAEDYEVEADDHADVKAESESTTSYEPNSAHDGSVNERRSNTINQDERQQARKFRATALKDGSDLGAIARTSAAVSTSPRAQLSTATVSTDSATSVSP